MQKFFDDMYSGAQPASLDYSIAHCMQRKYQDRLLNLGSSEGALAGGEADTGSNSLWLDSLPGSPDEWTSLIGDIQERGEELSDEYQNWAHCSLHVKAFNDAAPILIKLENLKENGKKVHDMPDFEKHAASLLTHFEELKRYGEITDD